MKKSDIHSGVVYRNKISGNLGVLFGGFDFGCLGEDEVGMVYRGDDNNPRDGNTFFIGTNPNFLEEYKLYLNLKIFLQKNILRPYVKWVRGKHVVVI